MTSHALIVDDNPNNALVAEFILEELGISSHTVLDATQTLSALKNETYDLLLLDWMMPRLDGMALLEQIRALPDYADLTILMCTARTAETDRQAALNAGATAFISKPITLDAMQTLLGELGYVSAPKRGVQ